MIKLILLLIIDIKGFRLSEDNPSCFNNPDYDDFCKIQSADWCQISSIDEVNKCGETCQVCETEEYKKYISKRNGNECSLIENRNTECFHFCQVCS